MEKVVSLGIREYGVYNDLVADTWRTLINKNDSEKLPMKLVTALNNSDTAKVLLDILRTDAIKVMEGMLIAAYVLDTKDIMLYIPEEENLLRNELEPAAKDMGIKIILNSFVDVRSLQGSAFHHIETMAVLAEAFSDEYEPGVLVAVQKDEKLSELRKISYGAKVSEIIQADEGEIKGIEIGSKLYDSTALDLVIDEKFSVGNGVIIILSKSRCMIAEAEKRLEIARKIGCGKCTFCREGLLQLHSHIKDITNGKGKNEYLPLMSEIGEVMPSSTMCSVGKTGSDFLMGSLTYYVAEYDEHIKKKRCIVNVCSSFVPIYIDPELCSGCEECIDVCPVDCIDGKAGYIHMIDEFECTKCGKCIEVCEENAIKKASGRVPKLPDRLTKCGKFKKH